VKGEAHFIPAILTGLGRRSVVNDILSEDVAKRAVVKANELRQSLVQYLVAEKLASAKDVAAAGSEEFGDPIFHPSTFDYAAMSQTILSVDLIEKHRAIPLIKRSGRLSVALSDPSNINALEEIRFNTGMLIDPIVVEEDKL